MGKKKKDEVDLIQRERRCEAGEQCNYYYKCFDERDNPTENCAIAYCTLYTENERDAKDKQSFKEEALDIIKTLINYDDGDDSTYCCDDDCYDDYYGNIEDINTDDVILVLQDIWHDFIEKNKKITKYQKICFELSFRLLELLR